MTMPNVQPAPRQPPMAGVAPGDFSQVERLIAARRAASHRPLTEQEQTRLDEMEGDRCFYCRGFHHRYCPRVAEISFHQNGNLARVVYWPDREVDWHGVVFDGPDEAVTPEPE